MDSYDDSVELSINAYSYDENEEVDRDVNNVIIPHIEFLCKTSIGQQVLISTITLR